MNEEQKALISAYHDGELDVAGEDAARRLLIQSEAARVYLEQLRRCDGLLKAHYDPVLGLGVPDAMLKTIRQHTQPRYGRYFVPRALAASLAVVAVLIGRQTANEAELEQQLIEMRQQIAQLRNQTLENTPSGSAASWVAPVGGVRAEVKPLKTYRTADNRFCREYEERIEDQDGVEVRRGIACRAGKELWPDRQTGPSAQDQGAGTAGGKQVTL